MKTLLIKITLLFALTNQNLFIKNPNSRMTSDDSPILTDSVHNGENEEEEFEQEHSLEANEEPLPLYNEEEHVHELLEEHKEEHEMEEELKKDEEREQKEEDAELNEETHFDDGEKELHLSDAEIEQLPYFIEEKKTNVIEMDQYHPTRTEEDFKKLETEESIIYFSKYQRLIMIGATINSLYNQQHKIIPDDDVDDGKGFDKQKLLLTFESGRVFIETITQEFAELKEELEDLYENLDKVDMTVEDCLEFFGFDTYFNYITIEKDQNSHDYDELYKDLELIVHEFVVKMKDYINTMIYFYKIYDQFYLFAIPYQNSFDENKEMDIIEKRDLGQDIIIGFVDLYQEIVKKLTFFRIGYNAAMDIRGRLLEQIEKFKDLAEPEINGFESSLDITREVLFFFFLGMLF